MIRKPDNMPESIAPSGANGRIVAEALDNDALPPEGIGGRVIGLIRRRLGLAIVLCAILGIGGGVFGWTKGHKQYTSSCEILVADYADDLGFDPSAAAGPTAEDYINTQVEFIKSVRVVDRAMASDAWRGLGMGGIGDDRDGFLAKVDLSSTGQIIFIKMKDANPKVATAGAQALVDAYDQLHTESEVERYKEELDFLQGELAASINRQTDLDDQIRQKFSSYSKEYANFSADDLLPLFTEKLRTASELESKLREVRWQISARTHMFSSFNAGPSTQPGAVDAKNISALPVVDMQVIEEIARSDSQMNYYLDRKRELENSLLRMKSNGFEVGHPAEKTDRDELDALNAEIQTFALQYIRDQQADANGTGGGTNLDTDQLRSSESVYAQQLDAANADIEGLTQLKRDVLELREQLDEEKQNHDDLQKRYVALDRLSRRPDRAQVIQRAEEPGVPTSDSRPMTAAGTSFAGVAVALSCILGLGFTERRMREPGDTGAYSGSQRPILGLLPDLSGANGDVDLFARAGDCIHHIRTSLQLWYGWVQRPVIVISAPSPGVGKTTITLGLGLSYAAANSRTLLIDFDLVGGGLSRRARVLKRDRIGRILREQGKIQLAHLRQGLEVAGASGIKLGEALVKLNFMEESDLQEALSRQNERSLGVMDALEGASLSRCVSETEIPNLSILGVGGARAADAARVAPADVQRLLDECRKKYDIVLIDTGPLPGSLEGAAVSAAADGVILIVSRGELKSRVQQSFEYAAQMGYQIAGVVFNRASARHLSNSLFSSSASRRSESSPQGEPGSAISERFGLFGKSLIGPQIKRNGNQAKKR